MTFGVTITMSGVATAVGIAGGVNAITGGGITKALGMGPSGSSSSGPGQSTQADPYGAYRPGDAAKLQSFYNDPNMINSDAGYQAQLGAGQQAVTRGMAATGQSQSGNEQTALNQFGQSSFNSYRQQMINSLMQSSGAGQGPASGVNANTQQNQLQGNQFNQGLGNIMSGIGGIKSLFSGSGSNTGGPNSGYGTQSTPVIGDTYLGGSSATTYGVPAEGQTVIGW